VGFAAGSGQASLETSGLETSSPGPAGTSRPEPHRPPAWVERLQLTDFRNYEAARLSAGPEPVVLTGPNGAGKTNLLEALSLLTAGQGLRRAPYPELARIGASAWAVAARVNRPEGAMDIGTGLAADEGTRSGRIVRIDGQEQSGSGSLSGLLDIYWLTPAMDGLFTGPASERRRFLDRLIPCFDPGYRARLGQFERAMQQRNRLLAENVREQVRFAGFERVMAETGVAVAAARVLAVAQLSTTIAARREAATHGAFPWAELIVSGTLEAELSTRAAVDIEDSYAASLHEARERDRAAGRTLEGPHRSDLVVGHGPKQMPASVCSTGEQKALLIGLVLAHAELVRQHRQGVAPLLLLDEIAAHLDPLRRAALFEEIAALGSQTWMTGTDAEAFSGLRGRARFCRVEDGRVEPLA
jgi:DNA replication and repair protein RecF